MSRFTQVQQPAPQPAQPKAVAPQAGDANTATVAQLDQSINELSGAMLDAAQGDTPAPAAENDALVATVGAVVNLVVGAPIAEVAQVIMGARGPAASPQDPQAQQQTSSFWPGADNKGKKPAAAKKPEPLHTSFMPRQSVNLLAQQGQQSIFAARQQPSRLMPGQAAPAAGKGRHIGLAENANIASSSLASGTRGLKSSLKTSSSMTNVEELKRQLGTFQHARTHLTQFALDNDSGVADQRITMSLKNSGAEVQTKFGPQNQSRAPQVKVAPPVPRAPSAPGAAA